jgi:hypothetical protein
LPVVTLVIWGSCVVVGVVGLLWPDAPAAAPASTTQPAADEVQELQVDVTNEPLPDEAPPVDVASQTPEPADAPPEVAEVAEAGPPAILAALPSPDIAFEKLVDGPVRIVSAGAAAASRAPVDLSKVPLSRRSNPRRIVYGRGEGVQRRLCRVSGRC